MAKKKQLRVLRSGTVINTTSKKQESDIIKALALVTKDVADKFHLTLIHHGMWRLNEIVDHLSTEFPEVDFFCHFETSGIRPDGGFLCIKDSRGKLRPILISEVKNQGTNDLRLKEGLKKQSKGNAIERLGKNVIGLRAFMRNESIFPFVCFGYGCDFAHDSSILDRVATINMFGKLCKTNLHDEGPHGLFDRGSFYFREEKWSIEEMRSVMSDIAVRSVQYYFSKYGEDQFRD